MKNKHIFIFLFMGLFLSGIELFAENNWPKEIPVSNGGKITIYQPQPESLAGAKLVSRAAISVKKSSSAEPVFGVFWSECILSTDRETRMATLESIKITDVKFPDVQDSSKIDALKKTIETEIMKWNLDISMDELTATLDDQNVTKDDKLSTTPPKIIYSNKPSTLVIIDGEPIVKKDDKMNLERVNNTPYLIIKSPENKNFYLYGDKTWYSSSSAKDGFAVTKSLPESIKSIDQQIKKQITENKDTSKAPSPAPAIIVSTTPAELISSDGEAKFSSVPGTGLLYMSNTDDNIFMEVSGQQYYVILTGRWYKSASLSGPWTFVESDKLPADFAKIPEGSDKDVVLASVAGTDAAKEAKMDAQIPQTAKVDRKTATTSVTYDGEPKFEKIEGTSIELAVNTSSTVMRANSKYYAVDKGIWFVSANASGPWTVSDERPSDVDKIPATSPAYNTQYVYIYDSTPDVVYVGYTPGYMGCYVYGPTVVYGTGYYYQPWYGAYYYPRPVTYGFSMHYNPWTGWSMGVGVNYGMVHVSFHSGGGWYGCGGYHPPYGYHGGYHHHHGGYYGPHGGNNYNRNTNINIDNSNNIYRNNKGVSTRDNKMSPSTRPAGGNQGATRPSTQPAGGNQGGTRPSTQPAGGNQGAAKPSTQPANMDNNRAKPAANTPNNVYSDKQGNVYQNNNKGEWQQRDNGNWKSTSPSTNQNVNQMQRDQQSRERSNTNTNNAQRNVQSQQRSAPSSRPASRPSPSRGGGGRR